MILPQGLFIFNYINIKQIENLISYCEVNEKNIDIYTKYNIKSNKIIQNIEKKYDYIVLENKVNEIDFSFKDFLKPKSWCCLILSDYDNSNIDILKTKISDFGFNALLIPSKKYIIGNEFSIIYNNINNKEEIYTHLRWGKLGRYF